MVDVGGGRDGEEWRKLGIMEGLKEDEEDGSLQGGRKPR